VRVILFDKTTGTHWNLGWHQDRVIAVKERIEIDGFTNWSRKWGAIHVEPPFEIIERLVTVRLHCDDCSDDNGALEVIKGSHRFGRMDDTSTAAAAAHGECAVVECSAGDAVLLRTSILHRSGSSRSSRRRRVIHVDYADFALPSPLEWAYEMSTS
jgi:ectoine hydroxylase-related dioxygenase (phytanoyl-CoA dioxygenase family)